MTNTRRKSYDAGMEEDRKRVLAIVAGILVARHLKTADDLFDTKPSPRTESMVAAAVQWAERISGDEDTAMLASLKRSQTSESRYSIIESHALLRHSCLNQDGMSSAWAYNSTARCNSGPGNAAPPKKTQG